MAWSNTNMFLMSSVSLLLADARYWQIIILIEIYRARGVTILCNCNTTMRQAMAEGGSTLSLRVTFELLAHS